MAIPNFVSEKQVAIAALCRDSGAQRLDLFGSAVRQDFDSLRRDLDFVVVFDEIAPGEYFNAYFSLKQGLESLFERPVDLVVDRAIRNPYFRQRLESERLPVYAS